MALGWWGAKGGGGLLETRHLTGGGDQCPLHTIFTTTAAVCAAPCVFAFSPQGRGCRFVFVCPFTGQFFFFFLQTDATLDVCACKQQAPQWLNNFSTTFEMFTGPSQLCDDGSRCPELLFSVAGLSLLVKKK